MPVSADMRYTRAGEGTHLRGCTLSECRASSAESSTFDEWAPSLSESRMEYSLSDLPRPWLRSYSSNLWEIGSVSEMWLPMGSYPSGGDGTYVMWDCVLIERRVACVSNQPRARRKATEERTYAVVELGNSAVGDGQPGEEDKVHEGVNVTLLGEVECERALLVVAGVLEVIDDVAQEWERCQHPNLFPGGQRHSQRRAPCAKL